MLLISLPDFMITALAAIGAHRLWNYEDIFAPIRSRIPLRWWTKPLLCRMCNAFWIGLAVLATHRYATDPVSPLVLLSLAVYGPIRGLVWMYSALAEVGSRPLPPVVVPADTATPPAKVWAIDAERAVAKPPEAAAPAKPGCSTCAQKRTAVQEQHTKAMSFERRVVLMTAMTSFPSSYSVATCVLEQARMLAADGKTFVQIWAMEGANTNGLPLPSNVEIKKVIPTVHWQEDKVIEADVGRLVTVVRDNLMPLGNATVITHDLLFISHFISFAAAIHQLADLKAFAWLHVCHSAAGKERPRADALKYRATLPKGHYLLCLNPNDRKYLADYYGTAIERVHVAPNARDITTFGRFDPHALHLVHKHRLAEADVVQVFPVSGTRMGAKGLPTIIKILGRLAMMGLKTKLVIVNAHSNTPAVQQTLAAYAKHAADAGLGAENMIVTSDEFTGSAADGLPASAVRDLFLVSNLFIMPSLSEASSLVLLEAAMSGCLIVSNSSLHTLEGFIDPKFSIEAPFGSVREPGDRSDHAALARQIAEALATSVLNQCKRDVLRRFNHRVIAEQLLQAIEATPRV